MLRRLINCRIIIIIIIIIIINFVSRRASLHIGQYLLRGNRGMCVWTTFPESTLGDSETVQNLWTYERESDAHHCAVPLNINVIQN